MKTTFIVFLSFFLLSCSKSKTVMICGDHVCVNKKEANQFFEENLSIEVKIINPKKKDEIDIVELNLKENSNGNRQVIVAKKNDTSKILKTLTKSEIKVIKKKIKQRKQKEQIIEKTYKDDEFIKKDLKNKKKKSKKNIISRKNVYKKQNKSIDVCTILTKCSIDEIAKYLLEQGKKKDFPDITIRQ